MPVPFAPNPAPGVRPGSYIRTDWPAVFRLLDIPYTTRWVRSGFGGFSTPDGEPGGVLIHHTASPKGSDGTRYSYDHRSYNWFQQRSATMAPIVLDGRSGHATRGELARLEDILEGDADEWWTYRPSQFTFETAHRYTLGFSVDIDGVNEVWPEANARIAATVLAAFLVVRGLTMRHTGLHLSYGPHKGDLRGPPFVPTWPNPAPLYGMIASEMNRLRPILLGLTPEVPVIAKPGISQRMAMVPVPWRSTTQGTPVVDITSEVNGSGTSAGNGRIIAVARLAGGGDQAYRNDAWWEVRADGGVFARNGAPFYGSGYPLPIVDGGDEWAVGLAPMLNDGGYWIVTNLGGVITCGAAPFYGSAFGKPTRGIMAIRGGGYRLLHTGGAITDFRPEK